MKRFLSYVSLVLVSSMILTATGQGRGRQNYSRPGTSTQSDRNHSSAPGRPGNNGSSNRPGNNNHSSHPDNNNNRPGNNNRPSHPGNNNNRPGNNNRPSHPGNNNNRPGNNNRPSHPSNNNRPGNNNFRPGDKRPGNDHAHKPGGNNRPDRPNPPHNYRPDNRPTPPPNYGHRPHPTPPYRPYAPYNRPWRRPVPPPAFRPYRGCPVISTIFGIALGATIDYTLNYLMNGGYSIAGYGDNVIYLNNVRQYNYLWPTAQMHYNNGSLAGTELVYSTVGYDMSRYNMLYNQLVGQYGYPVSVQNNGGNNVSATWWGYNNGYITLSFFGDYANNGGYRYYTTLSYGN